jgi:hypothetical protein
MINKRRNGKDIEEVVLAYFKAPGQNMPGMTDILTRQVVYLPRYKLQHRLSELLC